MSDGVLRWWWRWRTVPTSSATTRRSVIPTATRDSDAAACGWWPPSDKCTAPRSHLSRAACQRRTWVAPTAAKTSPRDGYTHAHTHLLFDRQQLDRQKQNTLLSL